MSIAIESLKRLKAYRKCCIAGIIENNNTEKLAVDVKKIVRVLEKEMFKELHEKYPNFGLKNSKTLVGD